MMLCGGSPLTIKIQKGNQTLFAGTILEEIVTTKGFLGDPFVALLPDYMKEVFDNPGSTFAPNLDPFDPFASDPSIWRLFGKNNHVFFLAPLKASS